LSATLPPDVNEAHYLCKARHYWDPQWCAGDLFLESADAHQVFYWTFGWVAALVSLPVAAWAGRLLTWFLLAWSWWRLSGALVPGRYWSWVSVGLFSALLRWGHMAGEWVFGGVEAKGFAFVLLFLALEALARGRWNRMWLLLGAASSFHVLVGGWSLVAGLIAWLLGGGRPSLRGMAPSMVGGGLLSLVGLVPALALNASAAPALVEVTNRIYVYGRLSHHLVFHELPPQWIARHLGLWLLVGWGLWRLKGSARLRRLSRFVAGAALVAGVGICLDLCLLHAPSWSAALLRYYWFRLSDVMAPLAAALIAVLAVRRQLLLRGALAPLACVLLLVVANLAQWLWVTWRDPRPRAIVQTVAGAPSRLLARQYDEWREVCQWVASHTPTDALVLTPRDQQSFKWYAQRAEVVTWKDVPQDAAGIARWWQTMMVVYPPGHSWQGLAGHGEQRLLELADEYGFQYIVVDRTRSRGLSFPRLYPVASRQGYYEVYRVPEPVMEGSSSQGRR
jgi:hypothetical protein